MFPRCLRGCRRGRSATRCRCGWRTRPPVTPSPGGRLAPAAGGAGLGAGAGGRGGAGGGRLLRVGRDLQPRRAAGGAGAGGPEGPERADDGGAGGRLEQPRLPAATLGGPRTRGAPAARPAHGRSPRRVHPGFHDCGAGVPPAFPDRSRRDACTTELHMTWTQVYTPLGNLLLSTLVAAIPVVVLLGLLAFFHVRAHVAALIGLATALAIAVFVYGMPARLALMSAAHGAAFGLLPIGWIVLCAIFVYDITVHTGQFEVVKRTVAGLADDRRVQVLLIAFSFGAFIEGAAGFGTPVAISAAMLIGLGFKPLPAAGLALIGNTAPVAYGALGTPIVTLASVTGLDVFALSAMAGRQLPFFSVIVPFWLIWAMAGWRG